MTHFPLQSPHNPQSSLSWQEARAKRRAVLARAAAIRKANYKRFMQRQREFSNRDAEGEEI